MPSSPAPPASQTPLVDAAAELARAAHASQVRKGDPRVPYFAHLESVANRLRAHGYTDEVTLAAAYLHDVLEDQPEWAERVRARFPAELVATVELLTERKLDEHGHKRSKPDRFRDYVSGLREDSLAAHRAAAVSCADKLDNTLSLLDAERAGRQLLMQLNTRPGQHAQQLAALREVYAPVVRPELLAAYDAAARELASYIARWLPGRAMAIAAAAHLGQFDKAGAPYVLHPMRLVLRAATPEEQMVAALHDVLEDTPWTRPQLADEGFPAAVLDALECLTKREGETYEAFIERVLADPLATRVKLYDLEDNLNLLRLGRAVTERDLPRLRRYHAARERVLAAIARRERARGGGGEAAGESGAKWGGAAGLVIELSEESREKLRALASYPEVRADHVTLAFGVEEAAFERAWVPGEHAVGARVGVRVVGICQDDHVQAALVEVAGVTERPWDRGRLHVTVSKQRDARSKDSNALLGRATIEPVMLDLEGVVAWRR